VDPERLRVLDDDVKRGEIGSYIRRDGKVKSSVDTTQQGRTRSVKGALSDRMILGLEVKPDYVADGGIDGRRRVDETCGSANADVPNCRGASGEG